MSTEEQDLLRSAVKEFAQKSIEDRILKIEHDGIDDELLKALAAQGFLAARIPEKYGGSGIDQEGYLAILGELATFSPSVAAMVMVVNSLAAPLIGDADPETTRKLASGEARVAIPLSYVLEGNLSSAKLDKSGNSLTGKFEHVLSSNGSLAIAASETDNTLYLVKNGVKQSSSDHGLAFRGLNFGTIDISSSEFHALSNDGKKALAAAVDNLDLEISAIALGITRGALDKVLEYVKVRKTFDRPLKDYGPVSSTLSKLSAELKILENYLDLAVQGEQKEHLMLKTLAVDLVKRATKYSLQYHGGYGYIEDFGVEKFYRDSVGLSILFQRPHKDSQRLSEEIFGEKSGYL